MSRKKTHQEFLEDMKRVHGDKYIVLGTYIDAHTKILVKCNTCGHEWCARPSNLLDGSGCPECAKKKATKTHEEFINYVRKVHGDKYTVLGEYVSSSTKILVKCNTCGHEWHAQPSNLLQGHGCPKCKFSELHAKNRKSHDKFVQKVMQIHGDKITVLGTYTGSQNKILVKCNDCGREWEPLAYSLLQGKGCPQCAVKGREKKTHQQFIQEVKAVHDDKYIILGTYTGSDNKILVKCNTCGHEWNSTPRNLLKGYGCPECGIKRRTKTHK